VAELSQEEREELNAIYSSRTTSARNLVHEELLDHLGYEGFLRVFYVPREGQPAKRVYRLTAAGFEAIGKPPTP
jgi:hypothetical protein